MGTTVQIDFWDLASLLPQMEKQLMWGNKPKEAQYKQNKISLHLQPRNIAKMSDVRETKTETALKKPKEIVQKLPFPEEI